MKWCFQPFLRDTSPVARSGGSTARLTTNADPPPRPERRRHPRVSGYSQLSAGFTFTPKLVLFPRTPVSASRALWHLSRTTTKTTSLQKKCLNSLVDHGSPNHLCPTVGNGGWKRQMVRLDAGNHVTGCVGPCAMWGACGRVVGVARVCCEGGGHLLQ